VRMADLSSRQSLAVTSERAGDELENRRGRQAPGVSNPSLRQLSLLFYKGFGGVEGWSRVAERGWFWG